MKKLTLTVAAVLATISLALAQGARLQVIHNCADPAAQMVDIYLNNGAAPLLDNFEFRKATPFIDAPAGIPLTISVSAPTSTSAANPLATFTVTLEAGKKYVAMATGLVGTGFAANPNGLATGFDLLISAQGNETAIGGKGVSLSVVHGVTDAPFVDVEALGVATIVDNLAFRKFTNYITVPADEYVLNVRDSSSKAIVASYDADITTLEGGAGVVFASGFLEPAKNKNGKPFGLFVALADGTVLELAPATQALLQVIHNAPQLAAGSVDLYINGEKALDNFKYKEATDFSLTSAGVVLQLGVAPGTSASAADILATFPVTLTPGQSYVAVATGIIGGTVAGNPDGINTAFTILMKDNVPYTSMAGKTALTIVHGSPDAPTVDVVARNVATLVDNAPYKAITNVITVPSQDYTIDIKNQAGTATVASYTAPLSALNGKSAVVLATGFLNPKLSETSKFGLIAVLADGTVIELPSAPTSVTKQQFATFALYPVPANEELNINLSSGMTSNATYQMSDLMGRIVKEGNLNIASGENNLKLDVSNLDNGNYFIKITSNENMTRVKFAVSK